MNTGGTSHNTGKPIFKFIRSNILRCMGECNVFITLEKNYLISRILKIQR